MPSEPKLKQIVEAALLAAGGPMTLDLLQEIFLEDERPDKPMLRSVIQELQEEYRERGIELVEVGDGFRINVRAELAPWVSRLWDERPARYSRAMLETLALIAYRQPVTRGEIEDIRGVSVSSYIIKTMMEREWIRIVGHRDVPGRPALYATTRGFLTYFGLKSLSELPTLQEIRDLDSINRELELGLPAAELPPELDAENPGPDPGGPGLEPGEGSTAPVQPAPAAGAARPGEELSDRAEDPVGEAGEKMTEKPESTAGERIQKVLANAGFGSRREIERRIEAGEVKVNGKIARLGDRISPADKVMIGNRQVGNRRLLDKVHRTIVYNKPEGELVTRSDPKGRPTVFQRLPKLESGRWIAVGRLDMNTSGLMLFTTDGELANRLMHPSGKIEREYAVRVLGEITGSMVSRLVEGVELEDGPARFEDVVESGGEGANRWFHVVIMEGRNREVRRLWESVGARVNRLKRVRFGPVVLDTRLLAGKWRELHRPELAALLAMTGLRPGGGRRPAGDSVKPERGARGRGGKKRRGSKKS